MLLLCLELLEQKTVPNTVEIITCNHGASPNLSVVVTHITLFPKNFHETKSHALSIYIHLNP